jgi:hypothetical protein
MKRSKEITLKLLLELIVIFIGVYLASYIQKEQDQVLTEKRILKIYSALKKEISFFKQGADLVINETSNVYKAWNADFIEGKKPSPFFYKFKGVDRPPNTIWQATIESNGIELIDTELLYQLSIFYNSLESVLKIFKELKDFGLYQILPYQNNRNNFYPNGVLRADYQEYVDQFKNLINISKGLSSDAQLLILKLEEAEKHD